ncbi:hypothetical protein ABZ894_26240 [Nocardia beijingensis]|uniref:hypothetical protein n=1 Tax=Nocardia beijingensis TaxID=95162 RepID=UPI0033F10855
MGNEPDDKSSRYDWEAVEPWCRTAALLLELLAIQSMTGCQCDNSAGVVTKLATWVLHVIIGFQV